MLLQWPASSQENWSATWQGSKPWWPGSDARTAQAARVSPHRRSSLAAFRRNALGDEALARAFVRNAANSTVGGWKLGKMGRHFPWQILAQLAHLQAKSATPYSRTKTANLGHRCPVALPRACKRASDSGHPCRLLPRADRVASAAPVRPPVPPSRGSPHRTPRRNARQDRILPSPRTGSPAPAAAEADVFPRIGRGI